MIRIFVAMSLAVVFCTCSAAVAQEPTAREHELEELVHKLIDKVDRLESHVNELEGKPSDQGVSPQRLKAIEDSVAQLKQEQPATVDAQTWEKVKKLVGNELTMRSYWKNGLNFETMDESVKLKIGGRIQNDWAYFAEDGSLERRYGDINDRVEFRRARLFISGTINDNVEFKAQYDFAGGDTDFKDVYMGLKKLPVVGNLRVGHFKEPFGLEELTSSKYITFMERSIANTFSPSRNVGMMLHNHSEDKRMTWAAGLFRQTNNFGESGGGGGRDYNLTGRVTWLPIYEDKGKKLLHTGIAYTHQNYGNDSVRFREKPESHLAPRLVDTGNFEAEFGDIVGAELAWVDGPFSIQGEYVKAFIESRSPFIGNPKFWGAYLQASYFLTGEHRPYKTSSGTFGGVKPLRNYGEDGGIGAWELAARISYLDLNDAGIEGGRLQDTTLGLNWYLNPNLRTSWNYVYANPSLGGDLSIFQWRFQIAF